MDEIPRGASSKRLPWQCGFLNIRCLLSRYPITKYLVYSYNSCLVCRTNWKAKRAKNVVPRDVRQEHAVYNDDDSEQTAAAVWKLAILIFTDASVIEQST